MENFNSYHEAVKYLESFSGLAGVKSFAKDQKPDYHLKKTRYFLNLLGNPQANFRYIHIAGTSGKGSTANLIHHLLHKNGHRAGLFTSPYATTSIEKIRVDNLFISPAEFCNIVEYLKPIIDKVYLECPYGPVSYFEIFLAIALEHFRRQKCEWVVLETGMGGKLDATNIVENPTVVAITNIDLDHTSILGHTLSKIAKDKAGIVKPSSIFITAEPRPHLLRIFKSLAKEVKAKRFIRVKGGNKELALAIAKEIGLISVSFNNASKLPCRFEIIQRSPLVILDGAHNPAKIQFVLNKLQTMSYDKLIIVMAVADSKDHKKILKEIAPLADQVFFTRFLITQRECASPKNLLTIYQECQPKGVASVSLDPFLALTAALNTAEPKDAILVTGSFFLAGEIRKYWEKEEEILTKRVASGFKHHLRRR